MILLCLINLNIQGEKQILCLFEAIETYDFKHTLT